MHYREPSRAVIIKKRRPAIAVEGGSTRTTVRSQHLDDGAQTPGRRASSVRVGAGARERSSGAGNAGARAGGRDGQDSQPATSGRSGGGGASQNSGTGNAAGSRSFDFDLISSRVGRFPGARACALAAYAGDRFSASHALDLISMVKIETQFIVVVTRFALRRTCVSQRRAQLAGPNKPRARVENLGEPRNSSTHLALMCVEKIREIRDAYSSRFGCRGGVDRFRPSFAACERGGSVRPKLRRAAVRRKLHPYPGRDSWEGRPRARCDNRGASAGARAGCGNQERTAPRH